MLFLILIQYRLEFLIMFRIDATTCNFAPRMAIEPSHAHTAITTAGWGEPSVRAAAFGTNAEFTVSIPGCTNPPNLST